MKVQVRANEAWRQAGSMWVERGTTDNNLMVTPRPVVISHSPAWDTAQPLGTDSRRQKPDLCCPDRKALGEKCDETWDITALRVCYKSYNPRSWGCNTSKIGSDYNRILSKSNHAWIVPEAVCPLPLQKRINQHWSTKLILIQFLPLEVSLNLFLVQTVSRICWKLQSLFSTTTTTKSTTVFQTISGGSWAP